MVTLRFKDHIFTAEYITMLSKVKQHIPGFFPKTFLQRTQDIISPPDMKIYTHFEIRLITGEKFTKYFTTNDLTKEINNLCEAKFIELTKDCGTDRLDKIQNKKKELIESQAYEDAAKLRQEEADIIKEIKEGDFFKRYTKEIVNDIVIKELRRMAEESRSALEKIINETNSPTLI